jgi:cardiolipin synthase A/B
LRPLKPLMTVVVLAAFSFAPINTSGRALAAGAEAHRAAAATEGLSLIVEPGDIGAIDSVLTSPRHALDMTMYELADPVAEADLAADAARGVNVRVVLDRNREGPANTPAYDYLGAHGVRVHWAPSSYDATHEKAVVVDAGYPGQLALIMTLNLTSRYYSTTRDFAVVDRNPQDVAAMATVFDADFAGEQSAPTPPGADLVWSPGSEPAILALIGSARHSLEIENEEMASSAVVSALAAEARSGTATHVTMTYDSEYRANLAKLAASGVGVHLYPDEPAALYIHAKVIVVDAGLSDGRAFVGSENFSTASMGYNRELGLITSDPAIVEGLARVLAEDYQAAAPAHL